MEKQHNKVPLIGFTPQELSSALQEYGVTSHQVERLMRWIYRKRGKDISTFSDVPKSILQAVRQDYWIGLYPPLEIKQSEDGSVKYLFCNRQKQVFEAVAMNSGNRHTLCLSTQSGCRMGCRFCRTGSIGYRGNLVAGDIINQVLSMPDSKRLNRIVLMGMGEPLDNLEAVNKSLEILTADWGFALGKSNITISTVGLLSGLEAFLKSPRCNLAISLHSPFPDEREMLMPLERTNPISEIIKLLKSYPLKKPLRLTFEYVALGSLNLSENHAKATAALLKGLSCHLNIIPWNQHGAATFHTPTNDEVVNFMEILNAEGIPANLRKSMGVDIDAACGQMAGNTSKFNL